MIAIALVCASLAAAQAKPQFDYLLTVDAADLSGFTVELRIHNAPAALTLAAAAHPEYDDKYWRYIEGLRAADASGNTIAITRADSVLWKLSNKAGEVVVRYRLRVPVERLPRAAWRPFLTKTGGLVGGPHSFLYALGHEHTSARVTLELPREWKIATALTSASANSFSAPDLETLMESPMQVGLQSEWSFAVKGVQHRVFYWRLPNATPFDTTAFLDGIKRITTGAVELFGGTPYRTYTFMFQDGAYGGLEHPASVTLGAESAELAKNANALLPEIAHEFFHTWNLMHIKPVEYIGLDYRTQPPVAGLWFSEGFTMFYADLLIRRAGLPAPHPTRIAHLESLIARYLASPGHYRFSAEAISRVAYNAGPGALGDYTAGVHLTGELIGNVLDLAIRGATDGAKSLDDVMRLMNTRFATRGFTGADVQHAVEEVCSCSVSAIFDQHVRGAGAIDFDRYLASLGVRTAVTWEPALESNGQPMRDFRIIAYNRASDDSLRLVLTNPATTWGRAGLHSHDVLLSLNGKSVRSWPDLRTALLTLSMGDTATLNVVQHGASRAIRVPVTGYDRPVVRIERVADPTVEQRRQLHNWRDGY